MDVRSYSCVTFNEHQECFARFMLREDFQSGEIFEPKTVKLKFDLTSESIMTSPCLFDMVNSTLLWVDSSFHSLKKTNSLATNMSSNGTHKVLPKMKDIRMTIEEFISLHAEANEAHIVEDEEDADFVVGLGRGDLDVYDFTEINSRWI